MKINDIIAKFGKYQGMTRRSATKFIFSLIRNKEKIRDLEEMLNLINKNVCLCEKCGNIAFEAVCEICQNAKREHSTVCIVEDFEDITNLEKGLWYNGIYHVLGGLLSAQKGMMPDALNTKPLFERIQNGEIFEIIFASTSSFEWRATMYYLTEEIKKIPNGEKVSITEFAHGLPIGSSFEYMDEGTLQIAYQTRRAI
jgi:recombination protein RecR